MHRHYHDDLRPACSILATVILGAVLWAVMLWAFPAHAASIEVVGPSERDQEQWAAQHPQEAAAITATWRKMMVTQLWCYQKLEAATFGWSGVPAAGQNFISSPYAEAHCGELMATLPYFGRSPGMAQLMAQYAASDELIGCSYDDASGNRDLGQIPAYICDAYLAADEYLSDRGAAGLVDCAVDIKPAIYAGESARTMCRKLLSTIYPFWSP